MAPRLTLREASGETRNCELIQTQNGKQDSRDTPSVSHSDANAIVSQRRLIPKGHREGAFSRCNEM
jgi:hypothetical protein